MKSKNILIVDDSGFIRYHMRSYLEDGGYVVYEASQGSHVLYQTFDSSKDAKIGLDDIDLVLLDLYLPDYDGSKVLKHLQQKYPEIPVIMVSVEKRKSKIIELIDMGAIDYLIKPVPKEILLTKLKKYLEEENREEKKRVSVKSEKAFDSSAKEILNDNLLNEIDRVVRSECPLVVMTFRGSDNSLKVLYDTSMEKLRRIDTVIFNGDTLTLLLPVTGEQGSEIVKEKVFSGAREIQEDLEFELKTAVFPRDVSQELINSYRIEEICENFKKILKFD